MRFLLIVGAMLFTGLGAGGQGVPEPSTYGATPAPELMLGWLHSPDPRVQAWAAHDILIYHATDLAPELEAQLERTTPANLSAAGRLAGFRTTLAMLDTLIQLGATVPAATLVRIEKLGYNAQPEELVLLSRLPWDEAEAAVLSFYKPGVSSEASATRLAAQLLSRHPPKGFAAEVLASILVTGRIEVHDAYSGGDFGSGCSACAAGGSRPETDTWPEIGRYLFQDPPPNKQPLAENESLFLSGPDPVYLLRVVSRKYYAGTCGGFSALNDAIRSHLVGTLLGGTPLSPFPEQVVTVNIQFQSRELYRAQVQAFVEDQKRNFDEVAVRLTSLGLLTEEERQAASLHLHLSLHDFRAQPAEDLPTIAFRPPVEWVSSF